jgi:hypothetical protein
VIQYKYDMKISRLLIITLLLLTGTYVLAEDLSFVASSPDAVVKGEKFRVSYKINTSSRVKDFRAPAMNDFSVLSGPNQSSSSSMTFINGKQTTESSITYSYVLIGEEEGTFTIPAATISVGKEQLSSNTLTIKVLPSDKNSQNKSSGSQSGDGNAQNVSISNEDIFMLATVDKTTVYEQEALILSYKVYVSPSLNLTNLSQKMPDLKNFHTQEVDLPTQKEFKLERYNGRNYQTLLWMQYVLFPQQSGQLEIPATSFEGIISQPVQSNDMFDMFFNAGRYVDMKKILTTPKIKINVKPLPSGKTSEFYGGVGEFSISSSISTNELKTNDALTIKVILSGTGNLKLIKTPEIKFPSDFDIYDPKIENKYTIKNGKQTGNKVFEYLAIPRHSGEYTIPAVTFQYFDTKSGSYKNIKTQDYTIKVAKGEGGEANSSVGYTNKEDLRYVGEDVKFSSTGNRLISTKDIFFGSIAFYLCLIIPFIIIVLIIILTGKQIYENSNIVNTKVKKASSVATKRLKKAKKLMNDGKKEEFFDETLRALWGYVSDKLAIPVAQLSKDNIQEALKKRSVSDDLIVVFTKLLDDCEFARYAPGDDKGRMDHIYDEAANTISKMENSIK